MHIHLFYFTSYQEFNSPKSVLNKKVDVHEYTHFSLKRKGVMRLQLEAKRRLFRSTSLQYIRLEWHS